MSKAKQAAARHAASLVEEGMCVGLGTGSTALLMVEALAERGLTNISCVATSEATAARARELGFTMTDTYPEVLRNDLTLDGADQVDPQMTLVKGGGGALLREKLVARAAERVVIMVDPSKNVEVLGPGFPIPVEVVAFGWRDTFEALLDTGCRPERRMTGAEPFLTDGGNYILDCDFPPIADPQALELRLKQLMGVVDVGIFYGLADMVITGHEDGSTSVIRR